MMSTTDQQYEEDYPLHQLFECHSGKATDKWEQYLIAYESELAVFRARNVPVRLLEIGVQNGGSLELWYKYLPVGSTCCGLDIDERVAALRYSTENISVHVCDATDSASLERVIGTQTFDIIIDDGSEPGVKGSTILDMTIDPPEVIREGLGWSEVAAWL